MIFFKRNHYLLLLILSAGCVDSQFTGRAPRAEVPTKPAEQPSFQLEIATNSLRRANPNSQGQGEVVVRAVDALDVSCANCSANLPLQFVESTDGSTKVYKASFMYNYVNQTQLCKVRLNLKHRAQQKDLSRNYGIYLCPINLENQQRVCDKANAQMICNI